MGDTSTAVRADRAPLVAFLVANMVSMTLGAMLVWANREVEDEERRKDR